MTKQHILHTRSAGFRVLTPHERHRITATGCEMITACNGCSENYGDDTVLYHLSEAYLEQCTEHPMQVEQDVIDMLNETLQ